MPFLLRVSLPDVPGSLGRVTTTIGEAGGDIEAIEIVEHRADGSAVDDVLLETAPEVMPDSIVSACNRLDGVEVLWISRYAAGGNVFLDLEVVEQLTEEPKHAFDALVDLVPVAFRADWAMRVRCKGRTAVARHSTSAAPELGDIVAEAMAAWFPVKRADRMEVPAAWDWGDTVVAVAPLAGPQDMVVFGRRGGPEILDSEVARVQHLAALAATIAKRGS